MSILDKGTTIAGLPSNLVISLCCGLAWASLGFGVVGLFLAALENISTVSSSVSTPLMFLGLIGGGVYGYVKGKKL
ncbi:hypothetical protein [Pseudomonas syringae pv. coryli]|uniref:hypothetical protein n=1 Tax=Pseudomonas syringae pv. coryli TaxID=317659 RepID=UPI003D2A8418